MQTVLTCTPGSDVSHRLIAVKAGDGAQLVFPSLIRQGAAALVRDITRSCRSQGCSLDRGPTLKHPRYGCILFC
jgi:hypothetical protein